MRFLAIPMRDGATAWTGIPFSDEEMQSALVSWIIGIGGGLCWKYLLHEPDRSTRQAFWKLWTSGPGIARYEI